MPWLGSRYSGWGLGLLAALVVLLWLALPSRLPALGLVALILLGSAARFYALRPALVHGWLRVALTFEKISLGLILLLAFGLRFVGLSQSLPYFDNPDEPTMVNIALKMLQTGDFNPHYFRWPSLPIYVQLLVSVPTFFAGVSNSTIKSLNDIPTESFFLAGRVVSATLGVATVFVTFLAGRALYGIGVGLLGALVLAVLPLHSEHSHYVTPDIMVAFCATLTFLFAVYIYKTGKQRWYWWAGVAAGLTISSKYNVAVVLLTVALAHFLAPKERRGKLGWLAGTAGLATIVFLLTTPFALLDLPGFLNEMAFQVRHYTILGHGSASEEASWSAYLGDFYREAFVNQAIIVLAGSSLFALLRQRREDWLTLSLPAVGYFFFASAKVHFSRNLMPLLPPLAILSAVFLLAIAGWLVNKVQGSRFKVQGSRKVEGASLYNQLLPNPQPPTPNPLNSSLIPHPSSLILALVLFVGFFFFSIQHSILTDRYYLQPDTRKIAGAWIVQNIPAGAKLRVEPQTPILPAGRYQGTDEQRPIGGHPLEWYSQQGYDYLIASSFYYRDLMNTDPEAKANYENLFRRGNLLKEFPGESNDYPGPTIQIFKVEKP